jgi:hypothetical protein
MMKNKLTLVPAVLSTICLTIGLTRLASQLDPVSRHTSPANRCQVTDSPDCQGCNTPCELDALNYGSFSNDSQS